MNVEDMDIAYCELKEMVYGFMREHHVPFIAMDYVVSKVLLDIQTSHLGEVTMMHNNTYKIDDSESEDDN